MTEIPAFTKYERCPGCQGTGKIGIVKRPCPWCQGKGKLSMLNSDGTWRKK